MLPETENKRFADFSHPETILNPIVVSRILPDGSKEPIGCICQVFDNGECPSTFLSLNNQGEELFPPTEDYSEAESRFERYAKRLSLRKGRKIKVIGIER